MNKKTTLLIDADVLAFEASVIAEESIEWKEEMWTVHADMALAKARVINRVEEFKEKLQANDVVMCLSDRANFRRKLNPDYKSNRAKARLPIILRQVKQWIIDELDGQLWSTLEADDIISILATDKTMDEEIVLPALSQDLINKLDKLYPDKCPLLTDDDRMVWFKVGQRSVINYLQQIYDEQLQDNIITKD